MAYVNNENVITAIQYVHIPPYQTYTCSLCQLVNNATKKKTCVFEYATVFWNIYIGLQFVDRIYWEFKVKIVIKYICDCHKTTNEYIDWNLGLKCGHPFWLWPWPWPLIFTVKYSIGDIPGKITRSSGNKKNISISHYASHLAIKFCSGLDIEQVFFKVK